MARVSVSVNAGGGKGSKSGSSKSSKSSKGSKKSSKKSGKGYSDSEEQQVVVNVVQHQCTDIFFLLLFIAFWAGMIVVAAFAFSKGDPRRLIKPLDMYGNLCGSNNVHHNSTRTDIDLTDYPNLYFPTPLDSTWQYCVKECPTRDDNIPLNQGWDTQVFCGYGYKDSDPNAGQAAYLAGLPHNSTVGGSDSSPIVNALQYNYFSKQESCFRILYDTKPVLFRCVPANVSANVNLTDTSYGQEARDTSKQALADIYGSLQWIAICTGVAFVLSLIWLLILRWFAKFMVFFSIFLLFAICVALTVVLGVSWKKAHDSLINGRKNGEPEELLKDKANQQDTMFVLLCISGSISTIFFFLICFYWRNLKLAAAVIEVASHAMQSQWMLIFVPIFLFIAVAALFVWVIAVYIFLGSAGDVSFANVNQRLSNHTIHGNTTVKVNFTTDQYLQGLQLYNIFGMFWTSEVIVGIGQMTIAGSVSMWYYQPYDKKGNKHLKFGTCKALGNVFRYHFGSIAFGAFIVAVVKMIRLLVTTAERQLKAADNAVLKRIYKCLEYYLTCLIKIIQFVNKNAYIYIAAKGDANFCAACRKIFSLFLGNGAAFSIFSVVTNFLLFLGKCFIVIATGFVAVMLLRSDDTLVFWAIPFILIIIIAYFIACVFLDVFHLCVDTIFMCVLLDLEKNEAGNPDYANPAWMPKQIKEFLKSAPRPKNKAGDKKGSKKSNKSGSD